MDFSWSSEQLALRTAVLDFATRALSDDIVERDRAGEFSRDLWEKCAEFGIQGLPFPGDLGGGAQDILSTLLALETLGYACKDNGLLFALNAQMWSVQMPIWRYGSREQQDRYLTRMNSGEWIGAHGMSEPDSGSDAFALRTTARLEGDRYVLNGVKTFVSNASVADLFVIFASVDREAGAMGITGFLVERTFPGINLGAPIEKMGLRTSPMAEVILEDCEVPVENRLGRERRGVTIFNDSMEWERTCILSSALGSMQRQLERAVRYARERKQFGRPIGDFQAVSHRLAEMKVRLETARLMLYKAAWSKERNEASGVEAAMAKLAVSEAYLHSCLDAVQVLGGYGFTTEFEAERDLRDAVGSRLYSGTSDIQKALIARSMGF